MTAVPTPLPPELALGADDAAPVTDEQIDATMSLAEVLDVAPIDVAAGEVINDGGVTTGRWRIEDDGAAEWAYRMLAGLDYAAQEIEDKAAAWNTRILEWREGELNAMHYRTRRGFFEAHLTDYAMRQREADPSRKTFRYPSGTTKTTAYSAKATVVDAHAVIAWARGLPDDEIEKVLKVTTEVSLTGLREVVVLSEVADVVVLSCGEEVRTDEGKLVRAGEGWLPGMLGTIWIGDGVVCPSCSCDVLVGDITASHLEVQHPSLGDVPGTAVESAGLNVKVVPDHG